MKKIIILVFIVFSFVNVKASSGDSNHIKKSNRFNIGISLGAGIPVRGFGIPSSFQIYHQPDTISGFGSTGFHFDFSAEAYPFRNFGFEILIGGNLNSFSTTAYNNSIYYSEATSTTTTANSYYIGEYLAGICYRGAIINKLFIRLGLMFGVITANYPTINTSFSATTTQSAGTSTWSAQSADAFAWDINAGLTYQLRKHLSVLFDFSYSSAHLNYPSSSYTETLQSGTSFNITNNTPSTMLLGLIKPTLGVAYGF